MMSALIFLLLGGTANAKCEGYVRKAASTKGKAVIKNFKQAHACDIIVAQNNFFEFMKSANDLETLTQFTLAAIKLDPSYWISVTKVPGKIKNYQLRDSLTKALGGYCEENPELRLFLQKTYEKMGDTEFKRWDDAYIVCQHEEINSWIVEQAEKPPEKVYSGKYNAIMDILRAKKGIEALSHLEKAAISASKNGPYKDVLIKISETVTPGLGEEISADNRKRFEETLLNIANNVEVSKTTEVAHQLAASGSEQKAATLLPKIYPNVYTDGFLYGAAAIELANCKKKNDKKDKKEAVVHVAEVHDKKVLWSIREKASEQLLASKAKLAKCEKEGEWVVVITKEPISSSKDIKAWSQEIIEKYKGSGYKTKLQKEKKIIIK